MKPKCAVAECRKPSETRGWCSIHYRRWKAHGDPNKTLRPQLVKGTVKVRFWSKIALPNADGCMIWLDSTDKGGYGVFRLGNRQIRVHRLAYELLVGPIPDEMVLDHVRAWGCADKRCCNPDHLEPVTTAENTRRSGAWEHNAKKTHCKYGHPYDEKNTRYTKGKSGIQRGCKKCDARRHMEKRWGKTMGKD